MTQETHMTNNSIFLDWFEDINPEADFTIPDEDLKLYDMVIEAFDKFLEAANNLQYYMEDAGLDEEEFYQAWDEYCDELTNPIDMDNFPYHFCETLAFARAVQ